MLIALSARVSDGKQPTIVLVEVPHMAGQSARYSMGLWFACGAVLDGKIWPSSVLNDRSLSHSSHS